MDFHFPEEAEAFRAQLRAFIDQELPDWWRGMFIGGEQVWPFTIEFCRKLAGRGWLTRAWPKEYGGQGGTLTSLADARGPLTQTGEGISHWEQAVVREEMWAAHEPRGPQYMNLNFIGPTLMMFGSEEQKRRHMLPMARGEVIWCQGFSEPNAGSDLASLETRAVAVEGGFRISGQKIWTSYADHASWCFLLARTNPEVPQHKGITVFLLDMQSPGLTVRPFVALSGPSELNEVFLDDVFVPATNVVGEVNNGWHIITTALNFERIGVARYARSKATLDLVCDYARRTKRDGHALAKDPLIRQRLAQLQIEYLVARTLNYRVVDMQARGLVPTYEASIARVHNSLLDQSVGAAGMEILGFDGLLEPGDEAAPYDGMVDWAWRHSVQATIAIGTIEIQKNLIAQRGLGLPRG
ncbi:MAG: acyl-CoA dehydrogenase family protein [Chloroflexi bacterium]|nr:acyl-CoA dehydrogenase family protein [Chloroflexota bacterium]